MELIINTDGGGQPNTDVGGDAACGYVIETSDGIYIGSRSAQLIGTNNDAEYEGVLMALRDLVSGELFARTDLGYVKFIADSQLVVYQITGRYRCKVPKLAGHRANVVALAAKLPCRVEFTWGRREFNTVADVLCADAMVNGPKLDFHAPVPRDPRTKKGITRVFRGNKSTTAYAVEPIEPCEYGL